MRKVIISQPRYLPALNYLQRLYHAEVFVLLDDVQRQGRGFENRNRILIQGKEHYLTIPIKSSSRAMLNSTIIDSDHWLEKHKASVHQAYQRHPYYDREILDTLYLGILQKTGEEIMFVGTIGKMLLNICDFLGFLPNIVKASDLPVDHTAVGPQHLLDICMAVDAGLYISGENGREYGVSEAFETHCPVAYHSYAPPTYSQFLSPTFIPWMSFWDPLFNMGREYVMELIVAPLTLDM